MWATGAVRERHLVARQALGKHPTRSVVLRRGPSIRGPAYRRPRNDRQLVQANAQEKALFVAKEALKVGTNIVETAAGWVPESVPRPAAKAIVAVGSLVVFSWIFQKVLSTILTVVLLVGGAWLWISASTKDDGGSGGSSSSAAADDDEDPVAQARRIMDKYK